jgi:hypothetical protein
MENAIHVYYKINLLTFLTKLSVSVTTATLNISPYTPCQNTNSLAIQSPRTWIGLLMTDQHNRMMLPHFEAT